MTTDGHHVVIGRGGLLGSAIARRVGEPAGPTGVSWDDAVLAVDQIAAIGQELREAAASGSWRASWCAGPGFVGAGPEQVRGETNLLSTFLDQVRPIAERGVIFLASSAGALHAGGATLNTEASPPTPVSEYGKEKLRQEDVVREWCRQNGGRAVVGRISNLYGPGQNLTKPQGLVSRLVRASLLGQPLRIFVPLETTRDYVFVNDAAAVAVGALTHGERALRPGDHVVKLVCSSRLTTIGAIVAEIARIRRKRPPIVFGSNPVSSLQPRVLAFRSEVWPQLDNLVRTTIPHGVAAVLQDQLRLLGAGELR